MNRTAEGLWGRAWCWVGRPGLRSHSSCRSGTGLAEDMKTRHKRAARLYCPDPTPRCPPGTARWPRPADAPAASVLPRGRRGWFGILYSFGPDGHFLLKCRHCVFDPQANFSCLKKKRSKACREPRSLRFFPLQVHGACTHTHTHTRTHTTGLRQGGCRRAVNPIPMFISLLLPSNERRWNWLKMSTLGSDLD